jgi:hypothetical protein
MKKTVVEAFVGAYADGSGHRNGVKAIWERDDQGKSIVAHLHLSSPAGSELSAIIGFDEWADLRDAIDGAIADTGYAKSVKAVTAAK